MKSVELGNGRIAFPVAIIDTFSLTLHSDRLAIGGETRVGYWPAARGLMKKLVYLALAVAASAAVSGCATITRGTHDAFVVQTDPVGASVKTSNGFSCDSTPCSMRMERKSEFDVTITKAGYKTWTGHVTHKTAGGGGAAMAGNVLVGGIIGAVVDGNNGATQDLTPNPLIIKMEKLDDSASSTAAK